MVNKPIFAISPNYNNLDFPNGMTIEDKINVFADRLDGWQIGIAKKIIQHEIQHSDFALLHIVFSYFEMIGKYKSGYTGKCRSRINFKIGVRDTYPDIGKEEEGFLDNLYESVRNGLYHFGITNKNVVLRCDFAGSIRFNRVSKILEICASHLVNDLDIRSNKYILDLRDPQNKEIRKNFELRFDHEI